MEATRTMEALAREALQVQDACNLCGLAQGFARAMLDLSRLLPSAGTEEKNRHPVAVLWCFKLADLSRGADDDVYYMAYQWARELAPTAEQLEKRALADKLRAMVQEGGAS